MRALRDAALEYASRGWHVIPLKAGTKHPITRNGLKDATDDLPTVFKWWQPTLTIQGHNIGIVCNPSGLVVIDVDPRSGGDETLAEAERTWGRLPVTVSAITGGGGAHYVFRHPGGALRGKLGQGLDIKDHGYIVAPPSRHPSGRRYEWDEHPDERDVVKLPERWIEELTVPVRATYRTEGLSSPDPLRRIPAATYVTRITGREPNGDGFWQCPFHNGGQERTPSLKCDDHMWACYGCGAHNGKRCAGGNIYDFMALIMDIPTPPRGGDYLVVKDALRRLFAE